MDGHREAAMEVWTFRSCIHEGQKREFGAWEGMCEYDCWVCLRVSWAPSLEHAFVVPELV